MGWYAYPDVYVSDSIQLTNEQIMMFGNCSLKSRVESELNGGDNKYGLDWQPLLDFIPVMKKILDCDIHLKIVNFEISGNVIDYSKESVSGTIDGNDGFDNSIDFNIDGNRSFKIPNDVISTYKRSDDAYTLYRVNNLLLPHHKHLSGEIVISWYYEEGQTGYLQLKKFKI